MTKKTFIELADAIKAHNQLWHFNTSKQFTELHLEVLSEFCRHQNYNFKADRWLGYINNENGPSGGSIKVAKKKQTPKQYASEIEHRAAQEARTQIAKRARLLKKKGRAA
jgi:hypothetical protein